MSVSHVPLAAYADYSIYNQREDKYSPRSALVDASAQETPASLAQAQAFKKKIAKFLCAHMGKWPWKAAKIVERIPTNDPLKLENLYEVLNIIKTDKQNCNWLKERLSWSKEAPELLICQCVCFEDTTPDVRLTLRALMLYSLSGVDLSLRDDDHFNEYESQINSAFCITGDLRNTNYDKLKSTLAGAHREIKAAKNIGIKEYVEETEKDTYLDLQVLPTIIATLAEKNLCSKR